MEHGEYEGRLTADIHAECPGWQLFRDGCPGGETPDQVGALADRVIGRVRTTHTFEQPAIRLRDDTRHAKNRIMRTTELVSREIPT